MKNYRVSKGFQKKVESIILQAQSMREGVHQILIEGLIPCFKDGQNGKLVYLLDNLNGVSGSFRIQAVVNYLEVVGGLIVEYSDNEGYSISRNKEEGFTFDAAHLKECKKESNRFWKIAAPEKPLKVCDPSRVFNSAIVQVARSMALNELNEDEVKDILTGLMDEIKSQRNASTTLKWVERYKKQKGITIESELKEALEKV